jgi:hypothetical protein
MLLFSAWPGLLVVFASGCVLFFEFEGKVCDGPTSEALPSARSICPTAESPLMGESFRSSPPSSGAFATNEVFEGLFWEDLSWNEGNRFRPCFGEVLEPEEARVNKASNQKATSQDEALGAMRRGGHVDITVFRGAMRHTLVLVSVHEGRPLSPPHGPAR